MRFVAIIVLTLSASSVFAWGGRGHNAICMSAVHLVKEPGLQKFLKFRPHVMGHLCNIPDIYWKSLPPSVSKSGSPAHFIDPEVIGLPLAKIPLDYKELQTQFAGQPNKFKPETVIRDFPSEFGSLWWRVDQFFQNVIERKEAFATVTPPKGRGPEQDETLPYNKEIYEMMVNMGLMGHFVGDASQPLHNTADFDGYKAGHGGLHGYYEEVAVAEAPADLENKVVERGRRFNADKTKWLNPSKSVVERMREFSIVAAGEIPKILKADPIIKKSELKREKGMELKTAAERKPASAGWKAFGPIITEQMGRSARLLALFWDEMYVGAGRPDLGAYRSYRYPFTPDFVELNYLAPEAGK